MRLNYVRNIIMLMLSITPCHSHYGDSTEDNLITPTDGDKKSHYRYMMAKNMETSVEVEEKKESTIKISSQIEIPNSEGLRLVMEALKVIGNAAMKGMLGGFLPKIERERRESSHDWERSFLLDWILDMCGALIGRQKCSQKVACRTGKVMQDKLPGAQMMVVMFESFIPPVALDWFGVVRQSVIDRRDTCVEDYVCDFSQD